MPKARVYFSLSFYVRFKGYYQDKDIILNVYSILVIYRYSSETVSVHACAFNFTAVPF